MPDPERTMLDEPVPDALNFSKSKQYEPEVVLLTPHDKLIILLGVLRCLIQAILLYVVLNCVSRVSFLSLLVFVGPVDTNIRS